MPKIIDHVIKTRDNMKNNGAVADRIQELAQAAVLGGIQSVAWETYMKEFCKNADGTTNDTQLSRLTGTDGDGRFDKNRAYLVANGMCGTFTRAHFDANVGSIDDGLNVPGTTGGCLPQ